MRACAIVGHQDSGKTHLVVRLVRHFSERGLAVATLKHTHHPASELDRPDSDSARHFAAGAVETVLAAEAGYALFHRSSRALQFEEIAARIAPCDLLLVEGFKRLESLERIEVHRPGSSRAASQLEGAGMAPLALADTHIRALACPAGAVVSPWPAQAQRLDLDDTAAIAAHVLAHARALPRAPRASPPASA